MGVGTLQKVMSKTSRQKGQRGEREVCKLLAEILGGEYKRNLMQTQEGGYDVLGLDGFAIEVKYQEKLQIEKWWKQTVEQAEKPNRLQGEIPVLFFRRSREKWRVVVPYKEFDEYVYCLKCTQLYYSVIPVVDFMEKVNVYNGNKETRLKAQA